jgi:hypothetical protein
MSEGHEPRDRPATRENGGETEAETEVETAAGDEAGESRPRAELRWVQLREPKHALEIGRNGRVLDSFYHDGDDSWEVLLETYEGD